MAEDFNFSEDKFWDNIRKYVLFNDVVVKFKKVNKDVKIPYNADSGSVGYDLSAYFPEEECGKVLKVELKPNQEMKISTGISCEIPQGYYMQLVPRSSMGIKKNLILKNTVGVIDSSYRGEILMCVKNIGDETIEIMNGERICQAIILPYPKVKYVEVKELSETERGVGGFGSSGRL